MSSYTMAGAALRAALPSCTGVLLPAVAYGIGTEDGASGLSSVTSRSTNPLSVSRSQSMVGEDGSTEKIDCDQ